MTPLPPNARKYMLTALDVNPVLLDHLLGGLAESSPVWDFRPDPTRFTLREMTAHLADWEVIFLERATRMRQEDGPFLPDIDEGQIAEERGYSRLSPQESLRRFREGRARQTAFLRSLSDAEWERPGMRELVGAVSIGGQTAMVLGHDGYHLGQALEWLRAFGAA